MRGDSFNWLCKIWEPGHQGILFKQGKSRDQASCQNPRYKLTVGEFLHFRLTTTLLKLSNFWWKTIFMRKLWKNLRIVMADTVKPTWLRTAVVSIIVMYEISKQVSYLYFFNSQSLGFNLVTTSSHIGGIFGGCALPLVNAILYMWLLQIVYMYYKVLSRNDESYTKFCLLNF